MPTDLPQVAKDLLAAVDQATDAIAARMQRVIDAAAAAGQMTADQIATAFQPEIARLQALGKDPDPAAVVEAGL